MRETDPSPLDREHLTARGLNRRVVLHAGAAVAALAATGGYRRRSTSAQAVSETRAVDWYEADELDPSGNETTVEVGFTFTAVGAHWNGEAGFAPMIELRLSSDGSSFSDPFYLTASADEGRPTRDARQFSTLLFANGAQTIRYRSLDLDGNPQIVPGLALTFIDGSASRALGSVGGVFDLQQDSRIRSQPPAIVSRAEWGANESLRIGNNGEIWPPTYSTVEHVIVHHTATAGDGDPAAEIRSIYYYHAVTKGWGDIAYNYLVDRYGTIYEGRAGGQDVVGGHSYQYQDGSSGIALLGNYLFDEVSEAGQAAIVAIVAWVARDLDPYGSADFWARENLPTICGHRDVDPSTECPGDVLYQDIATIRDYVASALDVASDVPLAGLVIGDTVQVVTDDGGPLRARDNGGLDASIVAELPDGLQAVITNGPLSADGYAWYELDAGRIVGWAVADYLVRVASGSAVGRFAVGDTVAVAIYNGNLRNGPGLDFSVAAELAYGTRGLVIVGPHVIDGQIWYQLDTPFDIGWMADSILASADEIAPPAGSPSIGDAVIVATDVLRLRVGPGTSYSIVTVISEGTPGTVIDGPRAADGYAWYQIDTNAGTGWGAAIYLAPDDRSTRSLDIGESALVATDLLNIRADPSLDAEILDVLAQGSSVEIRDGPVAAEGFDWWNVSTSAINSGWCVGMYLRSS